MALTDAQIDATQRQSLYGAVYALSGTLKSRVSGLPDAPLRWATRTFSGSPGGPVALFEQYLGAPDVIQAELAYKPGDEVPLHVYNLPVRNLPFRHSESIVTAIIDEDYAWEGSTASLFVAYLKPGQTPEELQSDDWTLLRSNAQLGSPRDVNVDGFRLPLLAQDTFRRQAMRLDTATPEVWPNIDPADVGRVYPVVVGSVDSWVRMLRVDAGLYGFVVESVASGDLATSLEIQTAFPFSVAEGLVGEQVYVNRVDKLSTVTSVDDLTVPAEADAKGNVRLNFSSAIDHDVPQGALVQERKLQYAFLPAANRFVRSQGATGYQGLTAVAFETFDGRVIPFKLERGIENGFRAAFEGSDVFGPPIFGQFWGIFEIDDDAQPPALIPRRNLPDAAVEVTQEDATVDTQPDFELDVVEVQATKDNVPTGPGFASAAFDGSLNTGYSVPGSSAVTFTFPSVPGGVFGNNDTIKSTLRFTSQGVFNVNDGGIVSYINVAGSKDSYRVVLGTPEPFNQSVRFSAGPAGGVVYEIEWTHELETTNDVQRTVNTAISIDVEVASTGDGGAVMIPIRAVLGKYDAQNDANSTGAVFGTSPWSEGQSVGGGVRNYLLTRPTSVFANLQRKYLAGLPRGTGSDPDTFDASYSDFVNIDSYDAADLRFKANDIRLNFVLTEPWEWADLEAELAWQSRCHAFYGPNGHELIFMEDQDTAEAVAPSGTFLLPGTPNPNASVLAAGALIERTSPADIVNTVGMLYHRNWLATRSDSEGDRYLASTSGVNAGSVAVFGERLNPEGDMKAWAISPQAFLPSGDASIGGGVVGQDTYSAAVQASGLAVFFANRLGYARTRFAFETGHLAHGLQRGQPIRVAFAPAPGVFRNVLCEIESYRVSPINGERREIVARSIAAPIKGLTVGFIWTDVFIDTADTWPTRITNTRDRWNQYWGIQP